MKYLVAVSLMRFHPWGHSSMLRGTDVVIGGRVRWTGSLGLAIGLHAEELGQRGAQSISWPWESSCRFGS